MFNERFARTSRPALLSITVSVSMLLLVSAISSDDAHAEQMPAADAREAFTLAQAKRGEHEYAAHCSVCHKADLTGSERIPPLAGDAFIGRWKSSTVKELFGRVKLTMPQTAPQSLSDAAYADIVAFLLQANGYQAGTSELVADDGGLTRRIGDLN